MKANAANSAGLAAFPLGVTAGESDQVVCYVKATA